MASSSLWEDEIGTIFRRIPEGWAYVFGDYDRARNHVLFNALMMLFPGADPAVEWQMRIVSFVSVGLLSTGLLLYPLRHRLPITALIGFSLWAANSNILERSLHARGYGMIALAAFVQFWATARHLQSRSWGAFLIGLGALLAGSATVPTYFLFGAPLAFFALLSTRLRFGIAALAGATLVLGLFWRPMMAEIFVTGAMYREWFESSFTFSTVARVFSLYVFPLPDGIWALLGPAVLVLPWAVPKSLSPWIPAARIGTSSAAVFLLGLLILGTAPARTAAMAAIPVIGSLGLVADAAAKRISSLEIRLPAVISTLCLGLGLYVSARFQHLPGEDWKTAARFCKLLLPPGSTLDVSRFGINALYYLRDYPLVIVDQRLANPGASLLKPDSILLNAPNPVNNEIKLISSKDYSPMGVDLALLGRYRPIWIHFVPNHPNPGSLSASAPDGTDYTQALTDERWDTVAALNPSQGKASLLVKLNAPTHSVLLLCPDGETNVQPSEMVLSREGIRETLDPQRFIQIGRAAVLCTAGLQSGVLELHWRDKLPVFSEIRMYGETGKQALNPQSSPRTAE